MADTPGCITSPMSELVSLAARSHHYRISFCFFRPGRRNEAPFQNSSLPEILTNYDTSGNKMSSCFLPAPNQLFQLNGKKDD
jgi:hypothetical protein